MASLARLLAVAFVFVICACSEKKSPPHPEEAAVRKFIHHYFETWSKPDMDAYGACFHDRARIFFLDQRGGLISDGLTDFLHGQRMSHADASVPMVEKAESIEIKMDDLGAQAFVTWVLTKGDRVDRGTDLFTLIKDPKGGWKIISLTFYAAPESS